MTLDMVEVDITYLMLLSRANLSKSSSYEGGIYGGILEASISSG